MPRFNQQRMPSTPGWFDKLARRLRIALLMLITLAAAAVEFLMGLHSVHTGKPIQRNTVQISAAESFFWCVACLVITGGLFTVFMGWAKSSKEDPPE